MKRVLTILSLCVVLLCITACNNDEEGSSSGTLRFEATVTDGGITILNYQILNETGSIELVNEEFIQTDQSSWSVEHTASSGNLVIITGSPQQQGATLSIRVLYNGEVIGSSSSEFNASVSTFVP